MPRPATALRAAALAASLAGAAAAQDASERPARVVVDGEGRVASAPDMATLRLGAQAEAEEASQALDAASTAARALIEALRAAGVAEADLQTSELSLSPRYGYGARSDEDVSGYVASNVVTARLRDLDALGTVIDAAAGAGANRIDGLSFGLTDPEAAKAQARGRAVADARAAAETLAEAAGLALGPVLRMEETGGGGGPVLADAMLRAEAASVPIAQGEVETIASVRMVFALDGGDGERGAPED